MTCLAPAETVTHRKPAHPALHRAQSCQVHLRHNYKCMAYTEGGNVARYRWRRPQTASLDPRSMSNPGMVIRNLWFKQHTGRETTPKHHGHVFKHGLPRPMRTWRTSPQSPPSQRPTRHTSS